MFRYKILWFIATIFLIVTTILTYKKRFETNNFNYFIRDYFNKIFIFVSENERILNVEQLSLALSVYVILFYFFIIKTATNIESFKKVIKYNSQHIVDFYLKAIRFFGRIFIIDNLKMFCFFVGTYSLIFLDTNIANYIVGILDLLKLSLMLFLVLVISIVYNIKRFVTLFLLYTTIIIYIFFFNYSSFIYIAILYLIFAVVFLAKLFFAKYDV